MLGVEGERDRWRGEVDAQVSSLADAQLLELQNWVNETYHKKYVYEGVAVGADRSLQMCRIDGVKVE